MSFIHRHARLLVVGVACAALGGGAGAIASAGAAPSGRSGHAGHAWHRGLRRIALGAVHGEVVVPTRSGFATVTFDRGRVDSVSGQQLTLTEGTRTATYKTITVTVPASALVRDNGRRTSLAGVAMGQRVLVLQGPKRMRVIAHTPRTARRGRAQP